ncbi:MAG: hypothetical protein R3B06_25360 [Kofleriaceae bacterium]
MTTATLSAPSSPAFPLLARALVAGAAVRTQSRRLRALWASAATVARLRGRAHASRHDRAMALAQLAGALTAIDGTTLDVVGVSPPRPCLLVAPPCSDRDITAILAAVPAAAVVPHHLVPPSAAAALGLSADDDVGAAVAHALAAIRAGVSVVTTADATAVAELLGLASLTATPVVAVGARRTGPRGIDVVVRAPTVALPGEAPAALLARVLDGLAFRRPRA